MILRTGWSGWKGIVVETPGTKANHSPNELLDIVLTQPNLAIMGPAKCDLCVDVIVARRPTLLVHVDQRTETWKNVIISCTPSSTTSVCTSPGGS